MDAFRWSKLPMIFLKIEKLIKFPFEMQEKLFGRLWKLEFNLKMVTYKKVILISEEIHLTYTLLGFELVI